MDDGCGFEKWGTTTLQHLLTSALSPHALLPHAFLSGHPYLANMLAQQIWSHVIGPLLLAPLLQPPPQPEALSPKGGAAITPKGTLPQPACSLFVLERMFLLIDYRPLVNNIALAILGRTSQQAKSTAQGGGTLDGSAAHNLGGSMGGSIITDYDVAAAMVASSICPGAGRLSPLAEDLSDGGQSHPLDPGGQRYGSCREAIVAVLRGAGPGSGRSEQLNASGAVRMLVAAAR